MQVVGIGCVLQVHLEDVVGVSLSVDLMSIEPSEVGDGDTL